MKRGLAALLGAPALFLASAAHAQAPPPPYAPGQTGPYAPAPYLPAYGDDDPGARGPRSGFSLKLAIAPSYHFLRSHHMFGVEGQLWAGAQIRDLGAVHGFFGVFRGSSDGELGTTIGTFGAAWEFIVDRLRPGVGIEFDYLVIERVTNDDALNTWGGALRGFLTVDIVQSDFANLYAGVSLAAGPVSSEPSLFHFNGSLSIGGRFKAP